MRILRELSRRKLRTSLTIIGIAIGIRTLVVFSSMANKINTIVDGGSQFYVGKIIVSDAAKVGIGLDVVPMDLAVADQIRVMQGVAAVDPQIRLPFEEVTSAAFGTPNVISGAVAGADKGMVAGGERGVARAGEMLRTEAVRTMQLLGVPSVRELAPDRVRLRD